ncbi:MAG: phage gp6-like head-tail connector protein [Rhizobiales bacterium]|nr:phage gp6-like head-tail connector protein [Hyphomicrobiales bacterium]
MTDTLEILPLADLKEHLRLDFSDDDNLLAGELEAARGYVEGWCGPLDDFTDGVPPVLVQAMKMYVAHLFANREAAGETSLTEAPMGFFDLIDPHRLRAF